MNKNLLALFLSLQFFTASLAQAFDLGIRIRPPRIEPPRIPLIGEVIRGVGNAIEGAAKAVGNGVTHLAEEAGKVYAANTETFTNIGRIGACAFTYCVSEIVRQEELQKAEQERKREFEMAKVRLEKLSKEKELAEFISLKEKEEVVKLAREKEILDLEEKLNFRKNFLLATDRELNLRTQYANNNTDYMAETLAKATPVVEQAARNISNGLSRANITPDEAGSLIENELLILAGGQVEKMGKSLGDVFPRVETEKLLQVKNMLQSAIILTENMLRSLKDDKIDGDFRLQYYKNEIENLSN